jgi:hypothetical protein
VIGCWRPPPQIDIGFEKYSRVGAEIEHEEHGETKRAPAYSTLQPLQYHPTLNYHNERGSVFKVRGHACEGIGRSRGNSSSVSSRLKFIRQRWCRGQPGIYDYSGLSRNAPRSRRPS